MSLLQQWIRVKPIVDLTTKHLDAGISINDLSGCNNELSVCEKLVEESDGSNLTICYASNEIYQYSSFLWLVNDQTGGNVFVSKEVCLISWVIARSLDLFHFYTESNINVIVTVFFLKLSKASTIEDCFDKFNGQRRIPVVYIADVVWVLNSCLLVDQFKSLKGLFYQDITYLLDFVPVELFVLGSQQPWLLKSHQSD